MRDRFIARHANRTLRLGTRLYYVIGHRVNLGLEGLLESNEHTLVLRLRSDRQTQVIG